MRPGIWFIISVIILIGPLLTFYLALSGSAHVNPQQIADLVPLVILMTLITAAISALMHRYLAMFVALPLSVLVAEIAFIMLAGFFAWWMPNGRDRAEAMAWLPVLMFFVAFFGIPTAVSVSLGIGILVREAADSHASDAIPPRPL